MTLARGLTHRRCCGQHASTSIVCTMHAHHLCAPYSLSCHALLLIFTLTALPLSALSSVAVLWSCSLARVELFGLCMVALFGGHARSPPSVLASMSRCSPRYAQRHVSCVTVLEFVRHIKLLPPASLACCLLDDCGRAVAAGVTLVGECTAACEQARTCTRVCVNGSQGSASRRLVLACNMAPPQLTHQPTHAPGAWHAAVLAHTGAVLRLQLQLSLLSAVCAASTMDWLSTPWHGPL